VLGGVPAASKPTAQRAGPAGADSGREIAAGVRKAWVAHVMRLQADIASYETVHRPFEGSARPPFPRESIHRARRAAEQASRELHGIGRGLVKGARSWQIRKDLDTTKNAIRTAHAGLRAFYQSVRRHERRYKRRWTSLSAEERSDIVAAATHETDVRGALLGVRDSFPVAELLRISHDPVSEAAYDPHTKPSELAWKALASLVDLGEATLKRWIRGSHRTTKP
jgi:hypothetical protein